MSCHLETESVSAACYCAAAVAAGTNRDKLQNSRRASVSSQERALRLFPVLFLSFVHYIHFYLCTSSSDSTTTLSNRGAEQRKERRESRGGGGVWENRDARSAACNHGQMLHVALVIQACVHVAVVILTCLLLPQAMKLRGRKVRVSKTIIGPSVGDAPARVTMQLDSDPHKDSHSGWITGSKLTGKSTKTNNPALDS